MLEPTDADLLAYADEQLQAEHASQIEDQLRHSTGLRQRLTRLLRKRDQGGHTLGEIWRRERLSCPSRTDLGTYLLGAASPELADYIEFHLDLVGCTICSANLSDLRQQQTAGKQGEAEQRRQRYFESSAGRLKPSTE